MDVIETDRADVQVNSAGATSYVNNYKIMTMLGEGTFSKVYLCQNEAGNEFALKVINKSILKRKREYKRVDGKLVLSNAFQKVQREVAIMKKLAHSNLVRLYEVIDSPPDDKLFLVLELIRGGQIMYWDDKQFRYFARNTPTGVLGKDTVRDCLRDIVAALDYLHRNHVCHRDIKPENILLCRDQFKLADFGVAYMNEDALSVASSGLKLRSTEGTYHFLAPECTTGDEYDPYQVDVWALGVTMFALLLGTLPFGTSVASLSDVMTSIREDPLILPPDLDPECAELLSKLMEKNPHLRITIPQLKTHPWVSRSGGEVDRRPSGVEVMVTQQEIEAAFTPVNNFIVVMKLKMKMSSRLNNVRKSLANSPNSKRRVEAVPVTKHVPTEEKSEVDGLTLPKTQEMAPSEQPHVVNDRLQRRPSRLAGSISETVGSLATTLTRRKSQAGAISPIFDDTATPASSPVPAEDSPGKPDAGSHAGVLLRTMSRRNSSVQSLIPDIPLHAESEKVAEYGLSPGKGDGETESLGNSASLDTNKSISKTEEGRPMAYRLTKRPLRGFSRANELPEGASAMEPTSPTNRKKRRESLPGKRDPSFGLSAADTATSVLSVENDAPPTKPEGDDSPPRRLLRKNSMSFRALVAIPDLLSPADGDLARDESEATAGSSSQTLLPSESTTDALKQNGQSTAQLATTRPVVLSRRLSTRNSRSIRSLSISTESAPGDARTKPVSSLNEVPQVQPSSEKESPVPPSWSSHVHTSGDPPVTTGKSGSICSTHAVPVQLSRRHSMSFGALEPTEGPPSEADAKERETSSKSDAGSTSPTGNADAILGVEGDSLNPSSSTSKLSWGLSRRASTTFRAFPLTIDIPKREGNVKDGESATKVSPSGLSPIKAIVDSPITPAQATSSAAGSSSDISPSPRMLSPTSPPNTLKVKVDVQSDEHLLQPTRKAEKLPVLDIHLSPTLSPAMSPVTSPHKAAHSSDEETSGESTPRRRSSSPSEIIEATGPASFRPPPLPRKRSSSLKLDEFSSTSDEGDKQSDPLPSSIAKSSSPVASPDSTTPIESAPSSLTANTPSTRAPPLKDPDASTTHPRATSRPTSPLPEPDKRPQSPSRHVNSAEGDDDPDLTRKSSLAKVLDACLTAGRASRSIDAGTSSLEAIETPMKPPTPTRRHQVRVPPLVRPEVDHQVDSALSHGRHHQVAPIEKPPRLKPSPCVVEGDSQSASRPRRRSIVQAQDSLRVLFGGKSSFRLSMLDEPRGANYATLDKISTIKSKVCGIM